jgi:hypothetical protein
MVLVVNESAKACDLFPMFDPSRMLAQAPKTQARSLALAIPDEAIFRLLFDSCSTPEQGRDHFKQRTWTSPPVVQSAAMDARQIHLP